MRSSAVCGCDAEPGCLEERRRWTSGGEEDTRSIWDKNWNKHRLGRCHGGLSQPKQEGLRQLSAEEEQHVRRDASLSVCVCLCASCLQERGNCTGSGLIEESKSMSPFGTWDCVVLCCAYERMWGGVKRSWRWGVEGQYWDLDASFRARLSMLDWNQISPSVTHSLCRRAVLNTI